MAKGSGRVVALAFVRRPEQHCFPSGVCGREIKERGFANPIVPSLSSVAIGTNPRGGNVLSTTVTVGCRMSKTIDVSGR